MRNDITVGCTVNLMRDDSLVVDEEGYPYLYQVVSIHKRSKEVSLIDASGEFAGRFHMDDIIYYNDESLFSNENYEVGQRVTWVEYDSVYEGTISRVMSRTVEVRDVKLLMPLDYVRRLPYYKIYGDPIK